MGTEKREDTEVKPTDSDSNTLQWSGNSRQLGRGAMDAVKERHVASFLVRLWREPRETESDGSPLRGYIRHLQTGEEYYISNIEMMVECVLRQLQGGHTQRGVE